MYPCTSKTLEPTSLTLHGADGRLNAYSVLIGCSKDDMAKLVVCVFLNIYNLLKKFLSDFTPDFLFRELITVVHTLDLVQRHETLRTTRVKSPT